MSVEEVKEAVSEIGDLSQRGLIAIEKLIFSSLELYFNPFHDKEEDMKKYLLSNIKDLMILRETLIGKKTN